MPDTIEQFAKRLKEKYPEYAEVDDYELTERVVRKHPVYASHVDLPKEFRLLKTSTGYAKLDDLYEQAGREENVDPNLLLEQGRQETINFKPDVMYGRQNSPAGAKGAGQFMPGTAPAYGLKVGDGVDDRDNPVKSISAQAKYMRKLLDQFDNNEELALAGYNSGEYRQSLREGRVPKIEETQNYVRTIGDKLKAARAGSGKSLRDLIPQKPTIQPVPEAPATIEAQAASVIDTNSPRAAVLLTQPGQEKLIDPAMLKAFKQVQTPNGLLLVNEAKAKVLGVTDYQKDLSRLIGKVENHTDTTSGAFVQTSDVKGTELATSKVSSMPAAQRQVAADLSQFPQAATSELVNVQDAIARRVGSDRGHPDMTAREKYGQDNLPVDYLDYLKAGALDDSNENRAEFNRIMQGNVESINRANQESVDTANAENKAAFEKYKKDVDAYNLKRGAQPAGDPSRAERLPANFKIGDKEETNEDVMKGYVRYRINLDDVKGDRTKYAQEQARQKLMEEFGLSSEQAATVVGTIDKVEAEDPYIIANIPRADLATVIGAEKVLADYHREKDPAQFAAYEHARDKAQANDLGKDRQPAIRGFADMSEAEYNVATDPLGGGTNEDIAREQRRIDAVTPTKAEIDKFLTQSREELANNPVGGFMASLSGATGRTLNAFAGVIRGFGQGVDVSGQWKAPEWLNNISKAGRLYEAVPDDWKKRNPGFANRVAQVGGSLAGDVPRFMLLGRLPGGAVTLFATDAGLQSVGRGDRTDETVKEVTIGMATGLMFKGGAKIAQLAESRVLRTLNNPVFDTEKGWVNQLPPSFRNLPADRLRSLATMLGGNTIKNTPGQELAAKLFGEGSRIGTIVLGTSTLARIRGATPADSLEAGIEMALTDLAMRGAHGIRQSDIDWLAGKVFRATKDGETLNVVVEKNGDIKKLKGEVPDEFVDGDIVIDQPPKAPAPVSKVRALREQNPQRIEVADPEAVRSAAIDTRARKIAEALKGRDFTTIDELSKLTRINKTNIENAVMTLYGARLVELLPGNRVRLIDELAAGQKTDVFEKAKSYGQETAISSTQAPVTETPQQTDGGTSTAKPNAAAPEYQGKTVTHPISKEPLTFTGEVSETGTLIATNNFGRIRRVSRGDADRWLAEQANQPAVIVDPTSAPIEPKTEPIEPKKEGVGPRREKPKYRDLTQAVRGAGGIRADTRQARRGKRQGELERLSNKETGTTGLVNKNAKLNAEEMAKSMWESGYLRDVFETIDDVNGDIFLDVLENDFRGIAKQYSRNDDEERFEEKLRQDEEEHRRKKGDAYEPEGDVDLSFDPNDLEAEPQAAVSYSKDKLPEVSGPIDAIEIRDYIDREDNKFRPDQQLKFNQGTHFEPVRIIADPRLIELIRVDSARRKGDFKTYSAERLDKLEKELGIKSYDAADQAKELARKHRDKNVERIIILGTPTAGTIKPIDSDIVTKQIDDNADAFYVDKADNIPPVSVAAQEAATSPQNDLPEPTEAQIEAGNYKKGHIKINGLDISIENPVGSERSGTGAGGKKWSTTMRDHYGYIKRTIGADEEQVDVFVKEGTSTSFDGKIFVIDQVVPATGKFDEHKVMIGFSSEDEARKAYLSNYSKDWKGLGSINTMDPTFFKAWLSGPAEVPVAGIVKDESSKPRPTLHGVSPQELTPLLHARVLYAREQGSTPADIGEKYNLTPEQVESVGTLPEVGSGGQMSHKLIQRMVPAKQATPAERAEKIGIVNDLAAELNLPGARLSRDTEIADIKNASDAVRLAIAKEMGRERGSHMTQDDWMKWLDAHGDRLSYDTVAAMLDAFAHQSEHTANKVIPFVNDKDLIKAVEELDAQYGLENIVSFRAIPNSDIRTKIRKIGYQYGLRTTAIERAFSQSILDFVREKSQEAGNRSQGRGDPDPGEAKPATEGSRKSKKLDGIQFSRQFAGARQRIKRKLDNLYKQPIGRIAVNAKARVDRDQIILTDLNALTLIRQAVAFHNEGKDPGAFGGTYIHPDQFIPLRTSLLELRRQLKESGDMNGAVGVDRFVNVLDKAFNNEFKDVTFAIAPEIAPNVARLTRQEELSHRADFRVRNFVPQDLTNFRKLEAYNKAVAYLRTHGYAGYSDDYVHTEVIAKLTRDDAPEQLGIPWDDVDDIELTYVQQLRKDETSPTAVTKEFSGISIAADVRILVYDRPDTASTSGNAPSDGSEGSRANSTPPGSDRKIRGEGDKNRSRTTEDNTDRFSKLRQADLLSASRGSDESLVRRSSDGLSKSDREEISAVAKQIPDFGELYPSFDLPTESEVTFWNTWIKDKRETPIKEIIVNFRRSGLLTGFKTHLRNIVSNAANQVSEEAIRIPAWIADMAASGFTGERTVQLISPTAIARSFKSLIIADKTLTSLNQESGIARAWNILKNGSVEELKKNQVSEMKSGLPLLDTFINGTFRLLGAEDALFKTYAMRRSLEARARTLAITEARQKLSKHTSILDREKYVSKRKNEMLANPDKGMLLEAMLYADFTTYTNNNPISDWFQKVKDLNETGKAALEIIVPYDRTPTNIVLRTLEHTPAGFVWAGKHLSDRSKGTSYTFERLRQNYLEDFERLDTNREAARAKFDKKFKDALRDLDAQIKSATGDEADALRNEKVKVKSTWDKVKGKRNLKDAFRETDREELESMLKKIFPRVQQEMFANSIGRASLGSSVILLGMFLAAKGLLSGVWDAGDQDESDEFYERRDRGILNGSLILGNRRYQINDSPIGKTLVLGASLWERSHRPRESGQSKSDKVFSDTWDVGGKLVMEQPMLSSVDDYFGKNKTIQKRLGGLLGSFVPTLVADIADVADDHSRRNEKIQDATMNRIPGLRQQLPKNKYPREPYLRDRGHRAISKLDPTASRPVNR